MDGDGRGDPRIVAGGGFPAGCAGYPGGQRGGARRAPAAPPSYRHPAMGGTMNGLVWIIIVVLLILLVIWLARRVL